MGRVLVRVLLPGCCECRLTVTLWLRFVGNFDRDAAAEFLKGFSDTLSPSDMMLIGVDACTDAAKV